MNTKNNYVYNMRSYVYYVSIIILKNINSI